MSHYNKIKTKLKCKASLVKALAKMGFDKEKIQVHDTAVHLEGWHGEQRPETAEIVLPRKHVGGAANDIGFKKQADGTFEAIISDNEGGRNQGHGRYGQDWQNKLSKHYSVEQSKNAFTANGWSYQEKTDPKGRVQLVGTRW